VHWRTFLEHTAKTRPARCSLLISDDHAGWAPPARRCSPPCLAALPVSSPAKLPRLMCRVWTNGRGRPTIRRLRWPGSRQCRSPLKTVVAAQATTAPKLAAWMEENLPQGLTAFAFPAAIAAAAHQQPAGTGQHGTQTPHPRGRSVPNEAPCCASSARCWPKPAKNGKPEKLTSTWKTSTQPSVENAKTFYRKKLAPPLLARLSGIQLQSCHPFTKLSV